MSKSMVLVLPLYLIPLTGRQYRHSAKRVCGKFEATTNNNRIDGTLRFYIPNYLQLNCALQAVCAAPVRLAQAVHADGAVLVPGPFGAAEPGTEIVVNVTLVGRVNIVASGVHGLHL